MTEKEWLECKDPTLMLKFMRGKTSDRKYRLFAVGCCGNILRFLDDRGLSALFIAEKYADGMATPEELVSAGREVMGSVSSQLSEWIRNAFFSAHLVAFSHHSINAYVTPPRRTRPANRNRQTFIGFGQKAFAKPEGYASLVCVYVADAITVAFSGTEGSDYREAVRTSEYQRQTVCLREIFGNPFRPVTITPSWLAWNNGTVVKIAEAIYADKAFDHLPILADALQDSGCNNADILTHCRQSGEHVRGCWVVDLLLGKE